VDLAAGETIEIAMIGRDSVVGSDAALNGRLSLNRATVQVAGRASEIDVGCLRNLAGKSIFFREALVRHNHMVLVQAQQSAACNAVHTLEARLSRWLLRCRDLAGDDLALTQELLSRMLGVRRTSVTVVAHSLQTAGFIRYKRGHIHILDSEGLSDSACECYQTVKEQTETLRASPLN
jgi:CRP-like cAMP-binding protein